MSWGRRFCLSQGLLVVGLALWLPLLHLCFRVERARYWSERSIPPLAQELAARHLRFWNEPSLRRQELGKMRVQNPEWDFMGRTFLVGALANMALRQPLLRTNYLQTIDAIIAETLRLEQRRGMAYFSLGYLKTHPFVVQPARSLFVDGEIALMMALRRMVEERIAYREPLKQRLQEIIKRMQHSPVLSAESYPDEAWTFCNTTALAAMRIADTLDGSDHSAFLRRWVEMAKKRLIHAPTGLLISAYTLQGKTLHGPEGSSIWMVAHNLLLVDEAFARDQYRRARKELGRVLLGFGYAREWPLSWQGRADIDSGPIVPILGVSAGSSGLALLGAGAFADHSFLAALITSLHFAAFPKHSKQGLQFMASNQVGDAVLLYALVQGPLWQKVNGAKKQSSRSTGKESHRLSGSNLKGE